jgi:hypothetical protein
VSDSKKHQKIVQKTNNHPNNVQKVCLKIIKKNGSKNWPKNCPNESSKNRNEKSPTPANNKGHSLAEGIQCFTRSKSFPNVLALKTLNFDSRSKQRTWDLWGSKIRVERKNQG